MSDVLQRLRGLADVAEELDAASIAGDARALADRAGRGELFVACVGQFKRGKSTLVNALVGAEVLPTGVLPVTSTVTIVRFRAAPGIRVQFQDHATADGAVSDLASFVTETGNPRNAKGVVAVDVWLPSPLLASGLCLVDTPGIGSSSPLATEATRRFVPHVDAALVVLGADPPISGEEVALLRALRAETAEFIVVINKADRLTEADLPAVLDHTRTVLVEQIGVVPDTVFAVSASERIARGEPTRDWTRLEAKLGTLATEAKTALLGRRAAAAVQRIGSQLLHAVDATREALAAPLEQTQRRLDALRVWHGEAEQAVADLGLLLSAEARKAAQKVTADAESEATRERAAAWAELAPRLEGRDGRSWRAASEAAQDVGRHAIERALTRLEPRTARTYEDATARFVALANRLVERLAAAEPSLAQLPALSTAELGGVSRVSFAHLMTLATRGPWAWIGDHLTPPSARRRRCAERARPYLGRLVEINMNRVRSGLETRLDESRRGLETEIRARLAELVTSAERAADHAGAIRAAGERAVQPELERLSAIRVRVERLTADGA